jgi:hypothetical protein
MQGGHHPGRDPCGEPAVRGTPVHRERAGKLAPRAAGLQDVRDRREHRPVIGPASPAALVPFRVRRQQRLSEMPERVRAVLLNVIHTRSTNDLAIHQPQTTHGPSSQRSPAVRSTADDRSRQCVHPACQHTNPQPVIEDPVCGQGSRTASVTVVEPVLVPMSDAERAAAVAAFTAIFVGWWMRHADDEQPPVDLPQAP